jgi:hypothetical protein
MDAGMRQIDSSGSSGRDGIASALMQGQGEVAAARQGINSDAARTFDGLEGARGNLMSGDILSSLNNNYSSSMGMLQNAFQQGQSDPRSIYGDVFQNVSSLLSPLVQQGQGALNQFYGNFPAPLPGGAGGQLDPSPYLAALQSAYDPYMSNLNAALLSQNNMVSGSLGTAASQLNASRGDLGKNFGSTLSSIDETGRESVGRFFDIADRSPLEAAQRARELDLFARRADLQDRLNDVRAKLADQEVRSANDYYWTSTGSLRLNDAALASGLENRLRYLGAESYG